MRCPYRFGRCIRRCAKRVLSARLRARVEDVTELNARLRELTGPELPAPTHGPSVASEASVDVAS